MKLFSRLLSAFLFIFSFSEAATPSDPIRFVGVRSTPESETVIATIALPKEGEAVDGCPVWIQVRVDGYSLGSASQFERAEELVETELGQTIHVVIDNRPYFPINGPSLNPFNEQGYFYNESYRFKVPFQLRQGVHTVRIFPARSYGESLKGEHVFHSSYFYVGGYEEKSSVNLSAPYLTYNEPSNQIKWVEQRPVLLDFFLSNCELSADGYKIKATIDGKTTRTLTSWQPYYIYGLRRGRHRLKLQLLDENNKMVPGSFNEVEQSFTVY